MKVDYQTWLGLVLLLIVICLLTWAFFRALRRSEDPARVVFKCILSAAIVAGAFYFLRDLRPSGSGGLWLGGGVCRHGGDVRYHFGHHLGAARRALAGEADHQLVRRR
jgi:hypothetical protein